MNLISCDNCGVILDKDKLTFPEAYDENGEITVDAIWTGEEFITTIPCPVCEEKIPEK